MTIKCGGCKATGIVHVWNSEGDLVADVNGAPYVGARNVQITFPSGEKQQGRTALLTIRCLTCCGQGYVP